MHHLVRQAFDRDGVSFVSLVSTMLQRVVAERRNHTVPESLRCLLLGGGATPRSLLERCLRRQLPVAPTYGLTEAASQVATLRPDELRGKIGSVGKALLPTEIRIAATSY